MLHMIVDKNTGLLKVDRDRKSINTVMKAEHDTGTN